MDGLHDLGGRQGFGAIQYQFGGPVYHSQWSARVHALSSLARKLHIFNMDEYRHAIERMAPRHYIGASYYERVLTGTATLCVEKGLVSASELERLAGGEFPMALALGPGRLNRSLPRHFEIGDVLRVRSEHVAGHVRIPGYVLGKTGVVVGRSPPSPFPDASAHAMEAPAEPTCQVRFAASELWPGDYESADVYVDLFESYLEPV